VFAQNAVAKKLYERLGYSDVDREKIVGHPLMHYPGDALLMVRAILND
jgi:ribosomal protein S18 acetylase RimI-like enzyme